VMRSSSLVLLLLALLLAACRDGSEGAARVVLVTIDTLRADRLGSYGDLGAHTPVLDEVAAGGIRFEHAIAPTPLTLPSHASLMTGLQPPHHGVRHNSVFSLDDEIPVLAEQMRSAGYATAAFVGAFVLDARFGLDRGFEVYDDAMGERRASDSPTAFAERRGDEVVDAALDWLARAPDRFFLWVHLYDPHADYEPPERFLRRAGGDAYAGEIAFADAQVGRLLRHIGQRWGTGDLVLAVTSDHGESLGEHNERTHSHTIYDATQRVPLLLLAPSLPQGQIVEEQVRLVDLAPTLVWLAGAKPLPGIQGTNLIRTMHGREEGPRVAYVETLATQLDMGWSPLLGVRTPSHKYIRAPQPELYDLHEDPGETRNLALVRPDLADELDAVLDQQLEGARPVALSRNPTSGERARLESLGYVVPGDQGVDGELGVVGGPNPRDHILDVKRVQDALTALGEGHPRRALELLEPVGTVGAYVAQARARAALAAGRPELAVETLERIGPRGASDRNLLGMAYLAAGRLDAARETFESALEIDSDASGPLVGLARLAQQEGDLAEAERLLREAEERAPQPQGPRVERAALLLLQGRVEEADALLEGIGEEFVADPARTLVLVRGEMEAGRTERALRLLRRSLNEHPRHLELLSTYAATLQSAGRLDAAVRIWRRAQAYAPDDPSFKNNLAWGLAMVGRDLDRALELAREAAAALGDDPAVQETLAAVHLSRRDPAAALRAADRGLAAEPQAEVRWQLLLARATALADLGREGESRGALRVLRRGGGELGPPWRGRARALARRLGLPDGFFPGGEPSSAGATPHAGAAVDLQTSPRGDEAQVAPR